MNFYFEQKIFEDCKFPFPHGTYTSLQDFNNAMVNWVASTDKAKSYEVKGYNYYVDGQPLVKGVDYELFEEEDYVGGSGHTAYPTFTTYAKAILK